MTYTEKRLEDTIDNEMAYLWSAIEENLPKSQEMEALGQEKIFRAVKAGYISYRPIFIAQAIAEERVKIRKEITVFICIDEEVRKEMMKFLGKETVPYATILSDVTYQQVVDKIEELEN